MFNFSVVAKWGITIVFNEICALVDIPVRFRATIFVETNVVIFQ